MEDNDTLTYDTRSISTVFKNFFSSLAESLLIKLPNPPDKYNLESVINYYPRFTVTNDFCLNKTSENKVLKIIEKIGTFKAAGYLRLPTYTGFPDVFYEMELRFYQVLYLKSVTYQYPVEFSLMLAKLQN